MRTLQDRSCFISRIPCPHFRKRHLDKQTKNPVWNGNLFAIRHKKGVIKMQNQSARILGLVIFLITVAAPSKGFAEGWTWGPFSKSSPSRDSSPLYSSKPTSAKSSWLPTMKMPRMPWSSNNQRVSSYPRSSPSTWKKVSTTSKRWWNRTTEMLDPYPDPKPTQYTTNNAESKKSKSSWFSGWFSSKEPEVPRTANDFLAGEMVK